MSQADLLKNWKNRASAATPPAFPRLPEGEPMRASRGQRRLYLLQQLYPGNLFYQYAHRYTLSGPLDELLLGKAFTWLVDRHELLRSNFVQAGDEVLLTVGPAGAFDMQRVYVDAPRERGTAEDTQQRIEDVTHRPFNLEEDYLIRAVLVRYGPEDHDLFICLHHIIGDRGSLQLLEHELFGRYTRLAGGSTEEIAPLTVQFGDFAYRETTREVPESHYDYWRKQLAGELPLSALPHDAKRPAAPTFAGGLLTDTLDEATSAGVQALARQHHTTPNVVFLAAFKAFLYRFTGQEDILVGSPVSLRDHREVERLIGFLNETVVLRSQLTADKSFSDLVVATRTTMEAALENKDVPFDWLIDELQPERRGGVNPFFQTMFVYNAKAPDRDLPPGLSLTDETVDYGISKFDLTLFVTDTGNRFALGYEYANIFREVSVRRMADCFRYLLGELIQRPEQPVALLEVMSPRAKADFLDATNPSFPLPAGTEAPALLTELFVRNARAAPDATCVTMGGQSLTWAETDQRSAGLARRLLAAELSPGTSVALYAGRSPDLLVGILGILRAGGAYVPLDPEYPAERIDFILQDSGTRLVVHAADLAPDLPGGTTAIPVPQTGTDDDETDLPVIDRHQKAYLIYTSGSTGKPKGIVISHDNLARSTDARFRFYDRQPSAFLLLSSFAFDSSVAGIFWSVASGGKLVLSARRAEQDPAGLGKLIATESVTHTLMLPSLYQLVLDFAPAKDLASLDVVMVAGEACPPALVGRHYDTLPATRLVNEYGPTEGTVWSTAQQLTPRHQQPPLPIGRPVFGMGHYVLDENRQILPPGAVGELFLSGRQLTAGYHNRPDLTAKSFSPNPFVADERLYGTGDLVRYNPNNELLFLGRKDHQIKIRGHRIELGEISQALDRFTAVRESVALALPHNGELNVVAYVCPEGESKPELSERLTAGLRRELPAYMVPSLIVQLDEIPRLPNGKINRKALPTPDWSGSGVGAKFAPPEGETECQVAKIWRDVLKLDRVGRHDNFFEIGGNSLKSIRIIGMAAKQGITIAPHQLFNHQTVAELAAAVSAFHPETAPRGHAYEAAVQLRSGGNKPPLFCLHSGGGHVFFYQQLARKLNGSRSVYALQPKGLSGETDLPKSMQEMAADYIAAIKDIQPQGPYLLLGTCFSNALAVEMATQMTKAGDKMLPLIIVDSGTGTFMRPDVDLDTGNKLTNLLLMIRKGRWDKIARRLRVRSILGYRKVAGQLDEQRRNLYGTIGALNEIYAAYQWPTYAGKVLFIRSTEFAGRRDKDHHLARWKALAGEVDAHVINGEHLTLFQEPAVNRLAAKIDACLP